ncbi:hypothetical protein E2542_SST28811 [Spatholobus suberectus]|nr:hypothetical protein E2542_SST28811 [Spatholobus suberectus]
MASFVEHHYVTYMLTTTLPVGYIRARPALPSPPLKDYYIMDVQDVLIVQFYDPSPSPLVVQSSDNKLHLVLLLTHLFTNLGWLMLPNRHINNDEDDYSSNSDDEEYYLRIPSKDVDLYIFLQTLGWVGLVYILF